MSSSKPSWSKGKNVKFANNLTKIFVVELAEKAQPFQYRVHVTSAYRSPKDQVRVVCNNMQNTAGANLSVYGETTQSMYRKYCPSNKPALVDYETKKLANNIAKAKRKGEEYQGHGTGYAIDLSVSGMSRSTKRAYKKLIESMGAKVLWETSPEHFHVWLKDWKPKIDYGWTRVLAYGGFASAAVLTSYLMYRITSRILQEEDDEG